MNYEKLNDNELNFEVARHSFDAGWLERHYGKEGMIPDYCNSWADAGPVIELIWWKLLYADEFGVTEWARNMRSGDDSDKLRAAMIVFLMMKDAEK